jgi:hypothetical protein
MGAGDAWAVVASFGDAAVLLADSATVFDERAAGQVIVCGSHGGETAALFAAAAGAKAVILNDAGVGKQQAGIAGLAAVERYGMAAATVDYRSARIGDGRDTYAAGVVSNVNRWAAEAGVRVGMAAAEAAERMARWDAPIGEPRPATPGDRPAIIFRAGSPRIVGLDSASQIDQSVVGDVVLTGSHGGAVAGRAVKAAVGAAFFNDAGGGKDGAGVGRLVLLDRDGIPGGTVACDSARIGDARETYECGVLSHVNEAAASAGLRVGQPAREAAQRLAELIGGRRTVSP